MSGRSPVWSDLPPLIVSQLRTNGEARLAWRFSNTIPHDHRLEHIADLCSVAKECADLWPRIASNAGTVV